MARLSLFPTPIGDCGIAWYGDRVVAMSLPEKTSADTTNRLAARTEAIRGDPPADIRRAIRLITALLKGERPNLSSITCDFSRVDPFAQQVYAVTRAIPAGETLTYGDVASKLGDKQLARRVGQALGRNPVPIIVPCHRVLGANGRLTGFSAPGGIETKRKLLEIEDASIGGTRRLFDHLPITMKPTQ
ncbi:MAG: methylated-DNA--[protein]-cysteine S-methyltransferase [Pseudomonadota bacterium]